MYGIPPFTFELVSRGLGFSHTRVGSFVASSEMSAHDLNDYVESTSDDGIARTMSGTNARRCDAMRRDAPRRDATAGDEKV